jgi:hypothetical protein
MGTATTVSPWYKLFKKGESGVRDFQKSLVRRKEVLTGLNKFIFSGDTVMGQIVDVVSSIEAQKSVLSDNMKQLKILLEEERKAWVALAQALLKHNHTITISTTQLEHAETLRLDKNKVMNLDAQRKGAIASIKQVFEEYRALLRKILLAETMFLPFENNAFLNKQRLLEYFNRVKVLKAIDAFEKAERVA